MAQPLHDARFLTSASTVTTLGVCHAEVAFIGRSNVGKSSLLNALTHQKTLARTSKTPGRTRLINVFLTGPDRWLVDLPGYGFAVGPVKEKATWQAMIEGYLRGRKTLRMIYVLVDAEVGPTKLDVQVVEWLGDIQLPYRIVATKADQVKPSRALTRRKELSGALGLHPNDIAWVSADKGTGIADLRKEVAAMLDLL
jgi:GTP-binding protein